MTKEEAKQYIRSQIDSSFLIRCNDYGYELHYNKSYFRALKLSKITGQPVNEENFKSGEIIFVFNVKTKKYNFYFKIYNYLHDNYTA